MNETAITKRIKAELESRGFLVLKIKGGPMQVAGIPDLLAVKNGLLWCFEVKAARGRVTPLQEARMRQLSDHGARCFVVRSIEETVQALEGQTSSLQTPYLEPRP